MRVDELTGAAIGRYRVGGRIQLLPYASIHRGVALAQERPVLIWTFGEPYSAAAGFLEALQLMAGDGRTARIAGLLQVLEIGVQERRQPVVYLVTEDASQGFLVSLLQAGRAPGVFAITSRLARTMDQMHALGMVHGDIQPATVALGDTGPVLVGHAVRTVVSRVTPEAPWVDITRAFRPPEAPTSADPVRASDLWGLAALVYYLLVGRPPSPDGLTAPPSTLRPQLPLRVDQAVMRALSLDPEQRFSSGLEFLMAMRGIPAPVRVEPAALIDSPPPSPSFPSHQEGAPVTSDPATDGSATAVPRVSRLWSEDDPLTPATMRAQALPGRDGSREHSGGDSTQLIAMEPYPFQPKFRRRGSTLFLWLLLLAVAAAAGLLVSGRISF